MARDVDPRRLERLLLLLRKHGVTRYESGDLSIELGTPTAPAKPAEGPRPAPRPRLSIDEYLRSRMQKPGGN
jgi:hypothetical protein